MLQNPCKTLGFKKNMVYKIPPWGGGKPYPASGLLGPKSKEEFALRAKTTGLRADRGGTNYNKSDFISKKVRI